MKTDVLSRITLSPRDFRFLTLAEFCSNRVEPWAKARPSRLWYRSCIRPLLAYRTIAGIRLDVITSENIAVHRGRGYRDMNYLLVKAQRLAPTKTEFLVLEKAA